MSSAASPQRLRVDEEGKLTISEQADVENFLYGKKQDDIDARQHVRSLVIKVLPRASMAWPVLPSLQDLTIEVERLPEDQYPHMLRASNLPSLQGLTICSLNFRPGELTTSPVLRDDFEQLKRISIIRLKMERRKLEAVLVYLPKLTHLCLVCCNIGTEECGRLAQALRQRARPKLTHLNLGLNRIGNEGCRLLKEALQQDVCPNLTHLYLAECNIDAAGCEHIAQALQQRARPKLTHLNLGQNDIGNEGCEHLAQTLRQHACPNLTHLCLAGCNVDADGCKHIAQALQQRVCANLAHIDLEINKIGPGGCEHLAQTLRQHACPNLKILNLEENDICESGCAELGRALTHYGDCPDISGIRLGLKYLNASIYGVSRDLRKLRCPFLTHLKLSMNNLGDKGCEHLAHSLLQRACPNLTHLYLSNCNVGAEGCRHLGEALEHHACPKLTHLSLAFNELGDEGCGYLVRGLGGCQNIEELNLSCNKIETLPDALGRSRSLVFSTSAPTRFGG